MKGWTHRAAAKQERAFSRSDLLVLVVLVLSLLVCILMGAQSFSRSRVQKRRCLANLSQIMAAISLYTQDNAGFFPPNPADGNSVPGYNWCPGRAGRDDPDEFNPDLLTDGSRCLVAPYLRSNVTVFRCTLDPRKGVYQGHRPALAGTSVPAARTISMNGAVGTVDPQYASDSRGHSGKPQLAVNNLWLGNTPSNQFSRPWRTYAKTADIVQPTPAGLFVLIEENAYTVNDACFAFAMTGPVWIDRPSTLHAKAGGLAFADGHVEMHRWVDPRTIVRPHLAYTLLPPKMKLEDPVSAPVQPVPASPDWLWLSERTSAPAQGR